MPGHISDVASQVTAGLTTNESPYIEQSRQQHELYIRQPYELYTAVNHQAWEQLYGRMIPQWERYANRHYLEGLATLCLPQDQVPHLEEVNRFLQPRTGFRAKAVSGYVPAFQFFDCLRNREFPTTITIRRGDHLDYLPEPDIFHDLAGHVPMHTDPHFAEALVRFGACGHTAVVLAAGIADHQERIQTLTSIIRALARMFWFTIEFGLMGSAKQLKVYGSGLLSSHGEIQQAIESQNVQRFPFQLEWVINQSFEINRYQPLLFWIHSFDHLFGLVGELEDWMKQGKLNHVAAGEPVVNQWDLMSFLEPAK
jgi:phenylalanine-4-hydroxylase